MPKQPKLSLKQLGFLRQLYAEQGKVITDDVAYWMTNLPATEASKLIDTWISRKRGRVR